MTDEIFNTSEAAVCTNTLKSNNVSIFLKKNNTKSIVMFLSVYRKKSIEIVSMSYFYNCTLKMVRLS